MSNNTWMGIPLDVDSVDKGRRGRIEQWDVEAFEKLVKPVLEAGVSIKWKQYTPFFNDGDVCEFSTGEVRFKPADGDDEAGDYEDGFLTLYDDELKGGEEVVYKGQREISQDERGGYRWGYMRYESVYEPTGRVFTKHPAYYAMDELGSSFGHFEELLYDTFGDHAEVTITPEKIVKEYYSHD
jgi:hypothetical protein